MTRPLPPRFEVKVVGVSFRPDYPDNLHRLARAFAESSARAEASLVRDLDNAHDPNAVAVLSNGAHLGYLPRELAARAASEIDAGTRFRVTDAEVLIAPEHPERPGIVITCERVDGPDVRGDGL